MNLPHFPQSGDIDAELSTDHWLIARPIYLQIQGNDPKVVTISQKKRISSIIFNRCSS